MQYVYKRQTELCWAALLFQWIKWNKAVRGSKSNRLPTILSSFSVFIIVHPVSPSPSFTKFEASDWEFFSNAANALHYFLDQLSNLWRTRGLLRANCFVFYESSLNPTAPFVGISSHTLLNGVLFFMFVVTLDQHNPPWCITITMFFISVPPYTMNALQRNQLANYNLLCFGFAPFFSRSDDDMILIQIASALMEQKQYYLFLHSHYHCAPYLAALGKCTFIWAHFNSLSHCT